MPIIQLACDVGYVTVLMCLGAWLETVGEMTGVVDRYFTPFPLGVTGLGIVFFDWATT